MSMSEMADAKRMLARLLLPVRPLVTRRHAASMHGARTTLRRTLRASLWQGGDITTLARKAPVTRWPNLVV